MPLQPGAETTQSGKQHPLGNITLVQLVPAFPFEFRRNDDPAKQFRMCTKPVIDPAAGIGHDGKQGKLVDNPVIDGRRLKKK